MLLTYTVNHLTAMGSIGYYPRCGTGWKYSKKISSELSMLKRAIYTSALKNVVGQECKIYPHMNL